MMQRSIEPARAAEHEGAKAKKRRRPPEVPLEERAPAISFREPTLKDKLVSTALWGAGLSWFAPSLGAMSAVYSVVPSHKVNILGRLYCKGQIALTGCKWRAVVHPDVDPDQPYIFAQNHTNHLDHVMLYNATPHFKQGLELESHFEYPFYGAFMRKRGTIPVKKGAKNQTEDLREKIRREIDEGRSILAFPEGSRTRSGYVQPFRKGIFYIARDLGVPIVPVAVTGSFDLMRPGSLIMRPGQEVTVYCDAPIPSAGLDDADIPALADQAQSVVAKRVNDYWASHR